jgi:hypothetical protein
MADATNSCLDRLAAALISRGLHVVIRETTLTAANPALRANNRQGQELSPGLSQSVLLRPTDHGMAWHWIWPAPPPAGRPEPGAPEPAPTIEVICPADDITTVAARIANVIRVQDPERKGLSDA